MLNYPDNRRKFKNMFPWDAPRANAKWDNPVKQENVVYETKAIRSNPQGLPRDIRVKTAPKPEVTEAPPMPVIPSSEVVPTEESWNLPDVKLYENSPSPIITSPPNAQNDTEM